MLARRLADNVRLRVALVICLCFLLTSTGWLSWLYRVMDYASPASVDILTMGCGYFVQAVGIAAFMASEWGRTSSHARRMAVASLVLYPICLVPATLAQGLEAVLAFGYLANVFCGIMQGYYLACLAELVDEGHRGIVFGGAYAASTLLTWLLSLPVGGALAKGVPCLFTCALMALAVIMLVTQGGSGDDAGVTDSSETSGRHEGSVSVPADKLLVLSCAVVALVSLVKSAGFAFPSADLGAGVNLELSRVLYGVGLLLAGVATDRDRRLGLLCCAISLVMPFLMLALSGAGASGVLLWGLGYLLTGFYVLFRVVLLTDAAACRKAPLLAGFSLLFGRVGDALGTVLCTTLASRPLELITLVAIVFAVTMALMLLLYHRAYAPEPVHEPDEREVFERFASRHDLSAREREVLRLLLQERTNGEIAGELFVSEATVKFHVRNVLRKTGCRNRLEVVSKYGMRE